MCSYLQLSLEQRTGHTHKRQTPSGTCLARGCVSSPRRLCKWSRSGSSVLILDESHRSYFTEKISYNCQTFVVSHLNAINNGVKSSVYYRWPHETHSVHSHDQTFHLGCFRQQLRITLQIWKVGHESYTKSSWHSGRRKSWQVNDLQRINK